jgi:peptidoglycan/xylan/chitin deacetylase (PgdA/CDA1 family)
MQETLWPHGKKCAFMFCFDLDSDTIWFNKVRDMPHGMQFLKGPSVGQYGPKCGADRILRLLRKYDVKATFFIPAIIAERNPELVHRMVSEGHEIGHHGLYHEPSYGITVKEQMSVINRSQEIFKHVVGHPAVGFRCTGSLLPATQKILFDDPNTLYCSQDATNEVPEFIDIAGKITNVVRIPCRQVVDDYIQMTYNAYPPIPTGLPRIAAYEDVLSNFQDEVDGVLRYHGALSTAFHPQVSGSPGKSRILEQLLQYVTSNQQIWCTTCKDVADWWRKRKV